jgi:hypothetical protein
MFLPRSMHGPSAGTGFVDVLELKPGFECHSKRWAQAPLFKDARAMTGIIGASCPNTQDLCHSIAGDLEGVISRLNKGVSR